MPTQECRPFRATGSVPDEAFSS